MGASEGTAFLMEAARGADAEHYFSWTEVGARLGYTPERASAIVRSLGERGLVLVMKDRRARLLLEGIKHVTQTKAGLPAGGAAKGAARSRR